MQAGLHRLKRLGISRLTHPVGLSSAMNQLPDEAIALAAASHIERELQITPWNLTSNFVACTNQVCLVFLTFVIPRTTTEKMSKAFCRSSFSLFSMLGTVLLLVFSLPFVPES